MKARTPPGSVKPGAVYRITYRRSNWAPGKYSAHARLSERGARAFVEKLNRTKDAAPISEAWIEVMGGLWTMLPGYERPRAAPRPRRLAGPTTIGDWNDDDPD